MRKDYVHRTARLSSRRRRSNFIKGLPWQQKKLFIVIAVFIIFFLIIPFVTIASVTRSLPTPDRIIQNAEYSTSLIDRKGKLIYQVFDDRNIVPTDINTLPEHLIQATVAIEDKNFFTHQGFSILGIARGLFRSVVLGKTEGGSTLTQQLVKNTLLTPERTITRKIKEFILAVELERRFSKQDILEMYFNQTPYGGTAWGIESAAQVYFGKKASELSLLESAILAGFPQSPSVYSPYIGKKDAYIERTKQVLRRMREDRYITKEQERSFVNRLSSVQFKKASASAPATHFVFYVKDILDKMVTDDTLYKKGLVIKTTLDVDLQRDIEKIVREEVKKAQYLNISNAAVIVLDAKTGEIRAMVGSVDYTNEKFGKFNASLGLRQPGSTLKPFTYALAFEKGILTPASVLMDVPTEFATGLEAEKEGDEGPYKPVNYDGKYRGPMHARFDLGSSLNVPAVKTLSLIGVAPFLERVADAGLTTLAPTAENLRRFGLSITLGGGEVRLLDLSSAYTAFANRGQASSPTAIKEVRDYRNKLIYRQKKDNPKRIFSEDVVFLISHILSDNNARLLTFGSNNYLNIPGKTVAAKTGTTDDLRDNWTVGYTNDLVVAVWVGNNDNSKMNAALASGVSGAAPIWRRVFLKAFEREYSDGIIKAPKGVEAYEIDSLFGGLPREGIATRTEYFLKSSIPTQISPFFKKIKISKSTGKLANAIEIAAGNYEEKEFFVVTEEDPISQDGKNRWQEGISAWAKTQNDERWKPPTETSDTDAGTITISVNSPQANTKVDDNEVKIFAKAVSVDPIKSFKLYIDEQLRKETSEAVIDIGEHLNDGVHTLRFTAENERGVTKELSITIGVKQDIPTPTPETNPTGTP